MKLKIDLHVHTCYSHDGLTTPKQLVSYAQKAGLNGVAITDHDRVDGALKMAKELDYLIIPATEISSLSGHIIGLNIQEPIPKGLSADETVEKIHALGGLAIACHPKALLKSSLKAAVNQKFDAVETVNASALPFKRSVRQAHEMASKLKLAQVGGSDAHYAPEIGYAYTLVEAEPDREEIVKAISKGLCQPLGKAIPLRLRLKREILSFKTHYISRTHSLCSNH
jgi:predicted metal-dependent phosphoesterase TrpH